MFSRRLNCLTDTVDTILKIIYTMITGTKAMPIHGTLINAVTNDRMIVKPNCRRLSRNWGMNTSARTKQEYSRYYKDDIYVGSST